PAAHAAGEAGHHLLHQVRAERQQRPRWQRARRAGADFRGLYRLGAGHRRVDRRHIVDRSQGMSGEPEDKLPTPEELGEMSRDELVALGAKLDGVELVDYPDPW